MNAVTFHLSAQTPTSNANPMIAVANVPTNTDSPLALEPSNKKKKNQSLHGSNEFGGACCCER